ncbi:MAG: signal peptidase I [Sporichthya sp.]|nr:signal peptidase I [Sporichthya sp.]
MLAVLAAATTITAVRVDGVSMTPTLRDSERVLLRPFSGGDTPARFAVIVTRFSSGPTVVKRVIGLPGDGVRIDTVEGVTTVEVQPGGQGPWLVVDNPAWTGSWGFVRCCRPDGQSGPADPQVVPTGMLFLLGDNPAASQDSRAFGWAPIEAIDGVVRWRLKAWVLPSGVHSHVQLRALS